MFMTLFIAEKTTGAKIHIWNVSECNFWRCQDEISVGLFFCRTIDPLFSSTRFPLFFPFWSHLAFYSPLWFPLSCFRWEVNCKWPCFPSLFAFFVSFVVMFLATSHADMGEDSMIGEKTEKQKDAMRREMKRKVSICLTARRAGVLESPRGLYAV